MCGTSFRRGSTQPGKANAHIGSTDRERVLQGLFAEEGSSPARFIRDQRLIHARALLDDGEPISRTGVLSGFSDLGTFTRAFRRRFGCTPSSYLRGYRTLP